MYRENDARVYARLAVRQGANVQPGQTVIIRSSVECAGFVRLLIEAAYQAGAGDVQVIYHDQQGSRLRYRYASDEVLANPPTWLTDAQTRYLENGGCMLTVTSDDPDGFAGLDMKKVGRAANAQKHAGRPLWDQIDKGENQWTVIGAASHGWAKKIFPGAEPEKAMEKLWDAIYHTMRLDLPDPVAAWEAHVAFIRSRCRWLNESGIVTLKLKSGLGTDLTLPLVEEPVWEGGASVTLGGVPYNANMPTEEVFSAPHLAGADGRVVGSMPLNYQGSLIEGMSFIFKDGLVTDFDAEKGRDALALMLAADEGAKRLGEVALVPCGSLIEEAGILFYNTLFDENASCHLALGSGYGSCTRDGLTLTPKQRLARGINESVSHVDFMFGTPDLSVDGVRQDGSIVAVFREGKWAF